jgi:hypothetical protein
MNRRHTLEFVCIVLVIFVAEALHRITTREKWLGKV